MVSIRPAAGYVYLISNPSMKGLLKIGMTSRHPEERIKELYNTSVPTPFVIERIYHVNKTTPSGLEARIHRHLSRYRVNPRREFFKIEATEAHAHISKMLNTRGKNYRFRKFLKKLIFVGIVLFTMALVFTNRQALLQKYTDFVATHITTRLIK